MISALFVGSLLSLLYFLPAAYSLSVCDDSQCTFPDFAATPPTSAGITTFCSEWDTALTCWYSYIYSIACIETNDQTGRTAFNNYICTSEGRQGFVDHAPCLSNGTGKTTSQQSCTLPSGISQCSQLYSYLGCIELSVVGCGFKPAREYITLVSQKFTGLYHDLACIPYEYSEQECNLLFCPSIDWQPVEYSLAEIETFCDGWDTTRNCYDEQIAITYCTETFELMGMREANDFMCLSDVKQGFVDHGQCISNAYDNSCQLDEANITCNGLYEYLHCLEAGAQICGSVAARQFVTWISKGYTGFYYNSRTCVPYEYNERECDQSGCVLPNILDVTFTLLGIDSYCSNWDTYLNCVLDEITATSCTPHDDFADITAQNEYLCSSYGRQFYVVNGRCLNQDSLVRKTSDCGPVHLTGCSHLYDYLECIQNIFKACGDSVAEVYVTYLSKGFTSFYHSTGCLPYEDRDKMTTTSPSSTDRLIASVTCFFIPLTITISLSKIFT